MKLITITVMAVFWLTLIVVIAKLNYIIDRQEIIIFDLEFILGKNNGNY